MTRTFCRSGPARWVVWLGLFGWWVGGLSACIGYSVRTKAHTLKRVAPFVLESAEGRKVSIGKPWKNATVLVFLRGFW